MIILAPLNVCDDNTVLSKLTQILLVSRRMRNLSHSHFISCLQVIDVQLIDRLINFQNPAQPWPNNPPASSKPPAQVSSSLPAPVLNSPLPSNSLPIFSSPLTSSNLPTFNSPRTFSRLPPPANSPTSSLPSSTPCCKWLCLASCFAGISLILAKASVKTWSRRFC